MWSDIWQNAGWGTIIYLAALSAVDPELHEAAIVDGATKLQRIRHIDIPGILPIAVILLILEMGDAVITSHTLSNTASDRVFNAVNYLFLTVILLAVAYPLYFMAIASFSDPHLVNNGKLWLLLITVNRVARRLSGAIRAGTACQARLHHPERQHLLGAEQPELRDREQSGHPQHPHRLAAAGRHGDSHRHRPVRGRADLLPRP